MKLIEKVIAPIVKGQEIMKRALHIISSSQFITASTTLTDHVFMPFNETTNNNSKT